MNECTNETPIMSSSKKIHSHDNALESAFVRLPRPQKVLDPDKIIVPTRSALLRAQTPKLRDYGSSSLMPQPRPRPATNPSTKLPKALYVGLPDIAKDGVVERADLHTLGPIITLGTLTQNNVKWALRAQRGRSGLIMVKSTKYEDGLAEQQILETLNHRNITKLVHACVDDGILCLAIEYCRFTLAEILFVHLKPEEQQVQYIARSVSTLHHACMLSYGDSDLRRTGVSGKRRDITQPREFEFDPRNT
jgi:hypothetical protein